MDGYRVGRQFGLMPLIPSKPRFIPDDRGRSVPAWTPSQAGKDPDPFERELALRVTGAAVADSREQVLVGMLPIIVTMAVVAIFGLSPMFVLFGVMCSALVAHSLMRRKHRGEAVQISATLLSAGRCGSCAYPVAKLNPESDGCVSCPECGAAWKRDPQWDTRLALADAAAVERLNLPKDGTEDDRRVQLSVRTVLAGLVGYRNLAMTDVRGRLAPVFFPRFPWKPPPCWDQVAPEDREAMRKSIRWLGLGRRVLMTLLLSFPAFSLAPRLTSFSISSVVADPLIILQVLWVFFFLPLAIFGFLVRPMPSKPDDIARIFLDRGYCPSCATDLKRVSPSPDDSRECPHCLGTWRIMQDPFSPLRRV